MSNWKSVAREFGFDVSQGCHTGLARMAEEIVALRSERDEYRKDLVERDALQAEVEKYKMLEDTALAYLKERNAEIAQLELKNIREHDTWVEMAQKHGYDLANADCTAFEWVQRSLVNCNMMREALVYTRQQGGHWYRCKIEPGAPSLCDCWIKVVDAALEKNPVQTESGEKL